MVRQYRRQKAQASKDKDEAFEKFYELKLANPALGTESLIVVMDEMIEWTRKNRSAGTYRFYLEHGQQFTDWLKDEKRQEITVSQLSVDTFESYLDECSVGRRNGAVQMIKRVCNWANKRGRTLDEWLDE